MNTIEIEGNLQGYYHPIIGDLFIDKDKEVFMLMVVDSQYVAVSLKSGNSFNGSCDSKEEALGYGKLKFIGRDLKITLEGQKR
jgi:hypothetical protein